MTRPRNGKNTHILLVAVSRIHAKPHTARTFAEACQVDVQQARLWLNAMERAGLVNRFRGERQDSKGKFPHEFRWIK